MPESLAPDDRAGHFDSALVADDPLIADAAIFSAVALPILDRPEDTLVKQSVALGTRGAVVDGLRLRDLSE